MLSVVTSKDANGGLITKVEALTKEEYNKRKNSRMTTMTSLDEASATWHLVEQCFGQSSHNRVIIMV